MRAGHTATPARAAAARLEAMNRDRQALERDIVAAAQNGEFISKDDFRTRSGTGQSTCDLLSRLGILNDLPESNQLSIFDLGFS